ncbi:MAG TPA: glycosyl transferase [Lachnoclostridium phytofermentans]|uniref:Glycosyl transferase n=1 Tax=Lachnoclostridium phytofermentans TaxID=66219 RepID=A0A3D2X819_9FIRM|nr:glycosyltransferase [Lachnoclostridium sp.]HCL03262.1 glycosyl transferase [Lachnoclostridium phytofermentans]
MRSIPKVIHYCWFGGNGIPEKDKRCIATWKKFCSDYEIIEWNEQNYDVSKNKYMKQAYDAGKWSFVSDYARLDIIYNYGGIYLDTDVELIKNLDDLLSNRAFMGFESDGKMVNCGLGFGAIKECSIIGEMLECYDNKNFIDERGELNLLPIPYILTSLLVEKGLKQDDSFQLIQNMYIYPKEYFCPMEYETGKINITPNTYSIHHFHASWLKEKEQKRLKRNQNVRKILYTLFGRKIGTTIYTLISGTKSIFIRR